MNIALLLAAGSSTRAGQDKLWADVHGKPLWTLALETFYRHPEIDRIFLMVPKGHESLHQFWDILKDWHWDVGLMDTRIVVVDDGGSTRMQTFKNGLNFIIGEDLERNLESEDIIIDHNAASPFVTGEEISAVLASAKAHGACAVAQPVVDTIVEVDNPSTCNIVTIRERSNLRLMQTPQAVRGDILKTALGSLDPNATDLSSALLAHTQVHLLPAHPLNKKVTFAEDLETLTAHTTLGEDSHRFSHEGQLALGGLKIPDCPAMQANSDGDVILHAIGRALAQVTDESFSETADKACEGGLRDSAQYLAPFLKKVKILEVSLSLEGARPRIDPLTEDLKKSLASLLKMAPDRIHLSAHTGEDLSPFGRGEGLRCLALVKTLPH